MVDFELYIHQYNNCLYTVVNCEKVNTALSYHSHWHAVPLSWLFLHRIWVTAIFLKINLNRNFLVVSIPNYISAYVSLKQWQKDPGE